LSSAVFLGQRRAMQEKAAGFPKELAGGDSMQRDQDFDIARNIKAIEWLKTEIVIDAGQIGRALLNGKDELVLESIADSILCCYLLARRLGVSFSKLESAVEGRARMAGMQGHELEQWYNDLSSLAEHLSARRTL
jgi:hypothetical protein